ncbi:MAG: hypothetical protein ACM3TR_09435 [Caulobacteraceae bacterium]
MKTDQDNDKNEKSKVENESKGSDNEFSFTNSESAHPGAFLYSYYDKLLGNI